MQKKIIIFLSLINLTILNFTQQIEAQTVQQSLALADSMCQHKNYKEAERLYLQILFDEQHYTTSMLLKIIQINELKSKPNLIPYLYALNLYYAQNPSKEIWQKIQKVVDKKELKGHQITDLQYVISFYKQNKLYLSTGMILVFAVGIFYINHRKNKTKNIRSRAIFLATIVIFFLVLHNYILSYQKGIINQKSLLMNAPSAGSECLGVISAGDCLQVIDQQDVWYKVRNRKENMEGYIRKTNLLTIR